LQWSPIGCPFSCSRSPPALADRFDPRKVIQTGMALFIIASLSWGYFFFSDGLQMWQAMVILVIHGRAGVLWQTSNQMLLYNIVGPSDLESAVRLNAMARYLGILVGPAVGGAILVALGPSWGIMLNTKFYLPLVLWLVSAPYGPKFRAGISAPKRGGAGIERHPHHGAGDQGSNHHRLDGPARRRGFVLCRKCL
jgi:MFS family permease